MRSVATRKSPVCRRPAHLAVAFAIAACLLIAAAGPPPARAEPDNGDWPRWETPEEAGFSSAGLAEAERLWRELEDAPAAAFLLVYKGRVLAAFGDVTADWECHSVRKSFLSALYGIEVARGTIDLDATIGELGIDDDPPLTDAEKQARVVDLLMSRSGVYHEAACESPGSEDLRPDRGSHPPGTFFYYNNWDFNALGTIYRQESGRDIFEEFNRRIARPVGMQDFQVRRCGYFHETEYSQHPCYVFQMSARDRARFGQLYLQRGRWGDRQLVPEAWVDESTHPYSDSESGTIPPGFYYGYMWWVQSTEAFEEFVSDPRLHHLWAFSAQGDHGQLIMIVPDTEMVVVLAVDKYAGGDMEIPEVAPTLEAILTARDIPDLALLRAKGAPRVVTAGDRLRIAAKAANRGDDPSVPTRIDFYLSLDPGATRSGEEMRWVGGVEFPALAAGRRKSARLKTSLPAELPAGEYYLVTVLDRDMTNWDLRRDNNFRVSKKAIEVR